MNAWLMRYAGVAIGCATIGLAPFFPEPHLVGKVRWVLGGAVGMAPMDWFDLLLHGFPFLLLAGLLSWDLGRLALGRARGASTQPAPPSRPDGGDRPA